jgi:hypothetical protein
MKFNKKAYSNLGNFEKELISALVSSDILNSDET